MNILVTGGGGYIGSHACKMLSEKGYNPITFDNFSTGWKQAVKYGPCFKGDLLNIQDLKTVFSTYAPTAIMHFAGYSQVNESITSPLKYWRNNVLGSLNLLETSLLFGCNKIVFSSTCATYGDHDGIELNESVSQLPINTYGATKKAVEDMLAQSAVSSGLRSVIFRYFNVAGADSSSEIGEFHRPETHLIPLLLDATLSNGNSKFSIFGNDYDTRDGTCIRDFVHVTDLVQGHILGLENLLLDGEGGTFNLGTGVGHSVKEIIEACERVTGQSIPYEIKPRRAGDASFLVSGSKKAHEELGWQANYSDIDTIIRDAWNWHLIGNYQF